MHFYLDLDLNLDFLSICLLDPHYFNFVECTSSIYNLWNKLTRC